MVKAAVWAICPMLTSLILPTILLLCLLNDTINNADEGIGLGFAGIFLRIFFVVSAVIGYPISFILLLITHCSKWCLWSLIIGLPIILPIAMYFLAKFFHLF